MAIRVYDRGENKGEVVITANGYGPVDNSRVYVVIKDEVIVEAMSFYMIDSESEHPIMHFIHHSEGNPNWEAVATALLIFYEKKDPELHEILKRLDKTSEEYKCLVNAIKDILKDKSSEYSTDKNQSILMEV